MLPPSRSLLIASLLALAFPLTACDEGGDDGGTSTDASESSASSADDAADTADDAADTSDTGTPTDPGCDGLEGACADLCNLVCANCGEFEVQANACANMQMGNLDGQTCISCTSQVAQWTPTCESFGDPSLFPNEDLHQCPDDVERSPECQTLYECCLDQNPSAAPACENIANGGNPTGCQIAADMQYCP